MNRAEFLKEAADLLDLTEPLTADQVLADITEFDSLAVLNLLGLYDSIGVDTTPEVVSEAITAADLLAIADGALSDG